MPITMPLMMGRKENTISAAITGHMMIVWGGTVSGDVKSTKFIIRAITTGYPDIGSILGYALARRAHLAGFAILVGITLFAFTATVTAIAFKELGSCGCTACIRKDGAVI